MSPHTYSNSPEACRASFSVRSHCRRNSKIRTTHIVRIQRYILGQFPCPSSWSTFQDEKLQRGKQSAYKYNTPRWWPIDLAVDLEGWPLTFLQRSDTLV